MMGEKHRDFMPLIMWLCLLAGIAAIAFSRSGRIVNLWSGYPMNGDILFIGLYVLWMLVEFPITRKDLCREGKKGVDAAACPLYGLAQALTFLTALWFPFLWQGPHAAHGLGLGLFLAGVCYRLWAIRTLGRFYSHRVQTADRHRIVVSGPYRFTRHPAYGGMIIANAGISLYFFNGVTLCVFLFLLVPAILFRIAIEEKTLYRIEGYADYARTRKRLFPGIW